MLTRRAVPVFVLVLALALFWWTRPSDDGGPRHDVDSDVRACVENLQAIYDGLRAYRERHGHAPQGSGPAFFAELIASGVWNNDPENARRLTCPGPGATPVPPGTDYADPSSLGPASSAYAGRDSARHPLLKFPAGGEELQALVACDNARGMNHAGVVNVLYSDRTVKTFDLERLVADGILPGGTTTLVVGADSPLEELRVLLAD